MPTDGVVASFHVRIAEVQVFACLPGGLLKVDPVVFEHQLARVDLLAAVEALTFRIEHVGQCLALFLTIP